MNIVLRIIAFIKLKYKIYSDNIPIFENKYFLPYSLEKALILIWNNNSDYVYCKMKIKNNLTIQFTIAIKNYIQLYKNYYNNLGTLSLKLNSLLFNSFIKTEQFEDKRLKISEKDFDEIKKSIEQKINIDAIYWKYWITNNLEELFTTNEKENYIYVLEYWFNNNPENLLEKIPLILSKKDPIFLNYYIFLLSHIINFINWKELLNWYNKLDSMYVGDNQSYIDKIKKLLIERTSWFTK